ncbi:MAG: hypothetical protein WC254_04010 [Candidatus Woesearchaeota archaeon]
MLVVSSFVIATDWSSDSSGYTPGTGSTTGTGSTSSTSDATLTDWCDEYGCAVLTVNTGIYCYIGGRGNTGDTGDQRKVVSSMNTYFGIINDYEMYSTVDGSSWWYNLASDAGYETFSQPFIIDYNDYSWSEYVPLYSSVPWITKDNGVTDDVRLYRYEGKGVGTDPLYPDGSGCRSYGGSFMAVPVTSSGEGIVGIDMFGYAGYSFAPWTVPDYNVEWSAGTNIVWDEDEFDCEKIGGDWLDTTSTYEDQDSNEYYCCGDDYIWVNNKPLTEDQRGFDYDLSDLNDQKEAASDNGAEIGLAANYCLYSSKSEDDNDPITVNGLEDYYLCDPTSFDTYDDALNLAGDYEDVCYDSDGKLLSTCPHVLKILYDDEPDTDLGKWSAQDQSNPYVCRIKSTDEAVPAFNWTTINDAGDLKGSYGYPLTIDGIEITDPELFTSSICEQYLGGKWTGSHCCGNKYDYDSSSPEYVSESYSETTPITYEGSGTIRNEYACLQGVAYDDYDVGIPPVRYVSGGNDIELLNVNGSWYGCNVDDLTKTGTDWYTESTLITTATNISACSVMEKTYLCNYNVSNSQWEWYPVSGGAEGSYVTTTLRYNPTTANTFELSTVPWVDIVEQDYACCAGNTCWNGTSCVDEYTPYSYDTDGDSEEDTVSICHEGIWSGPLETKYDWYHNTDAAAIDYCIDSFACVCSSEEEDDTFCAPEGTYFYEGCTLTQNFYKNDHLCEADATSSQWTSRTKLLAFQMMDLAVSDYAIFCDAYSNTLNNYVNVEPIADKINSFCVLKKGNDVTVGVTLNSEDDEEPMTIDEDLLTDSFSTIFDQDIDCTNAFNYNSPYAFGEYYLCDTDNPNTIFYNVNMSALIYINNTYTATTLPYPIMSTYQTLFDSYKTQIITYIDGEYDTIDNPDGTPIADKFAGFSNVADYNRIYYNTASNIFGFEEIKYDEGDSENKYYLGVVYDTTIVSLNCDQIYAPYESGLNIHCNSDNGIVLERSTDGSDYWTSLTAGMRSE